MTKIEDIVIDPDDKLPVMVVGRWVTEEKHTIIKRYIDASFGARAKFSTRAYVDLFAGSGRVMVKHINHFADGGALAAWHMSNTRKGTFTSF
jgi:three-Cys-motif partner protein